MQAVMVFPDDMVAFDHTFAVLKNYQASGAKAVFTGIKRSTGEFDCSLLHGAEYKAD